MTSAMGDAAESDGGSAKPLAASDGGSTKPLAESDGDSAKPLAESDGGSAKPLPRGEGLWGEFFAFCGQGELRFQRCEDCGTWRHMPRDGCRNCGSTQWTWQRSNGRGRIYTWTVTHRALHPGFADDVPYAAVIAELDGGVRITALADGIDAEDLRLGMPVQVVVRDDGTYRITPR
ncbi:Zn-ribbon domain-containing OB-fold protein [Candidatus Poriferisodalis sp.]|uniref:Zn-ribbon domain-containing OB-fold protein n=1 Tax=Candidatus Poriferisodalis sp. TaxID=3101277 RepID=UPI003AF53A00